MAQMYVGKANIAGPPHLVGADTAREGPFDAGAALVLRSSKRVQEMATEVPPRRRRASPDPGFGPRVELLCG